MSVNKIDPALLLIDFQLGFDDEDFWGGNRNNKNAEKVANSLLKVWRSINFPIYHIQHASKNPKSPLHPENSGFAFKAEVLPIKNELVLRKDVNSAFIGTDLLEILQKDNISQVIIAGLTTNHCVSTTTRMAGNCGFEVFVISDATATFDRVGINGEKYSSELIHQTTLANLNSEFALVLTSDQLLQEYYE